MLKFELVEQLVNERLGKKAQIEKAETRLNEAVEKLDGLKQKQKDLIKKQAVENKDFTKEINKVVAEIIQAEAELNSRKVEVEVIKEMNDNQSFNENEIMQKVESYNQQFKAKEIEPLLEKLSQAKADYLGTLKQINEAIRFQKEEVQKVQNLTKFWVFGLSDDSIVYENQNSFIDPKKSEETTFINLHL